MIGGMGGTPASAQDADARRAALEADVRAVMATYPEASVGLAVRDPLTGIDLDVGADEPFHAASTMKVPVMIEVYRRAEAGRLSLDDRLPVRNAFRSIVDGSTYAIEDDSDDALYVHLGDSMTIRDLTERMITVSSNLATNLLIDELAADSVQATIERLGTRRMRVLRGVEDIKAYRQGLSNTATAADLAVLMARLMDGTAVGPNADAAMRAILLRQEDRDLIPAGLPDDVRVAHKTGWVTEIRHDAAIVYPPEQTPYVLVVLTGGVADPERAERLAAELTRTVHAHLRGPAAP